MKRLLASFFAFGILTLLAAQPLAFAGGACCAVKGTPASTAHVESVDVTENPAHVEHFADSKA